ncbi:hypothetical protein [Chryseolinea lacunae]|uniref:Uncharacterized protein n=1 Tax=Chryseolinea lacunae TaxID=2801331 RepID=A0ABS1KSD1_9BACT|nr:hypothetical protein [Chryseolinea lacunae]MBL0742365.1 hypothetical protein [Chryseolinea lacunae]
MILKFFFSKLSLDNQVKYLQRKGVALGTRIKDGRKIYIYMLRDLFVEVIYQHDNAEEKAEKLSMLRGLKNLNEYLENEFRTSF